MKDTLSKKDADAILKSLDEAIAEGPWDESNFLRVIGKKLHELRDEFAAQVNPTDSSKPGMVSHLANRIALRSGQHEVFVSLYLADGSSISSWERILMNLPKQIISRPIYANEEDIKALIRTKVNKVNEAYVSIYIHQSDILFLSSDKTPLDKLGKPLLTLKNKSISLDNINLFVHQSGVYQYHQGRLVENRASKDL